MRPARRSFSEGGKPGHDGVPRMQRYTLHGIQHTKSRKQPHAK